ncbi:P-loop containing nucleoside triphosphate hydrolase [Phytophthora cactorum]|nr:P-loop containing nucleoside triphosphate hydrolase [Phytophthora cactorum]
MTSISRTLSTPAESDGVLDDDDLTIDLTDLFGSDSDSTDGSHLKINIMSLIGSGSDQVDIQDVIDAFKEAEDRTPVAATIWWQGQDHPGRLGLWQRRPVVASEEMTRSPAARTPSSSREPPREDPGVEDDSGSDDDLSWLLTATPTLAVRTPFWGTKGKTALYDDEDTGSDDDDHGEGRQQSPATKSSKSTKTGETTSSSIGTLYDDGSDGTIGDESEEEDPVLVKGATRARPRSGVDGHQDCYQELQDALAISLLKTAPLILDRINLNLLLTQQNKDFHSRTTSMEDRATSTATAALQLPILPLDGKVLFPRTYLRLAITSASALQLLKDLVWEVRSPKTSKRNAGDSAASTSLTLAIFTRRNSTEGDADPSQLLATTTEAKDAVYSVGTVARVVQLTRMQGGVAGLSVLVQGLHRVQLQDVAQTRPYLETEKARLQRKIQSEVQDKLEGTRKEFLLRQQLEAIKKELGEAGDDGAGGDNAGEIKLLEDRLNALTLDPKASKIAQRELRRLKGMTAMQPEYGILHNYLDFSRSYHGTLRRRIPYWWSGFASSLMRTIMAWTSSALLEVLDPHQNNTFTDHYLNVPFDLSRTLFLATANSLDTIPGPLLDRMEVIELSGYSVEQKVEIARRYLLPQQIEANGLREDMVRISDEALRYLIMRYTREAGVRDLERQVGALCRYVAVDVVRELDESDQRQEQKGVDSSDRLALFDPIFIDKKMIRSILGHELVFNEVALRSSVPGVATGMSWSTAGGSILFVEASCTRLAPSDNAATSSSSTSANSAPTLQLTGKLGDVMKESAQLALSWLLVNAHLLSFRVKRAHQQLQVSCQDLTLCHWMAFQVYMSTSLKEPSPRMVHLLVVLLCALFYR